MALSTAKRRELISDLVANEVCEDGQEEWLESLTDNQLVALDNPEGLDELVDFVANAEGDEDEDVDDVEDDVEDEENEEDEDDVTDNMEEDEPKAKTLNELSDDELKMEMKRRMKGKGKKKKPTANAQLTERQWLRQAPPRIRQMVANAEARELAEREELVDQITANSNCEFTEDELMETSVSTLKRLATLANSDTSGRSNFTGRTAPRSLVGNSGAKETPLSLPDLWATTED